VIELLTAREMAGLDRETIENVAIPGLVLMENAADGRTRALLEHFGGAAARRGTVVLAGPGNNGGDGHAMARKLANRGLPAVVWLLADRERVRGDARTNLDLLSEYGVPVIEATDEAQVAQLVPRLAQAGVVVDALFGTGLERPLGGRFGQLVDALNAAHARDGGPAVLAVDIPSGVNATTGEVLGTAVRADVSVTFCRPKLGHYLYPGAEQVGTVEVVDIGVPNAWVAASEPGARLLDGRVLAPLTADRAPASHKGSYGHLLLVAGSAAMPGAAVLAANAALSAGVGLVTLVVPEGVQPLLRDLFPEVIVRSLPAANGGFAAGAFARLEPLLEGKTAVAIGPGFGRGDGAVALVREVATVAPLPVAVDADGLRALEGAGSLGEAPAPRVLTPHPGELAGLLGTTTAEVQADRPGAARRAARRLEALVVLKGARTLVAFPDGTLHLNPTGNPGMASAGTGDVLTGLLGGLLARGVDPGQAAGAAAYLHGLAGDVAAAAVGETALRASHITRSIPGALRAVSGGELGEPFRWR